MGTNFKDTLQIEIEFLSKNQASLDQLLASLSNIDALLKAVGKDADAAAGINKVFNKEGLANFERTLQQTQKSIEAITKKGVDLTIFSGGGKQAEERGARLLNILEQVGKTVAALNGKPFNLDLSSVAKARDSFAQLQAILGSLKDTPGFKALPQGVKDTLEQVATSANAQVKKIAKLPDDILRDIGGGQFKKKIGEQQVALLKELFATFTQNSKTEIATIQAAYEATKKQLATATADVTKLEQKVKTLQEKVDAAKTKAKAKSTDGEAAPRASKAPTERQKIIVDVEIGKIKQPEPPPLIKVEAEITKVRQPEPPPVIKVTGEVDKVTVPKAQKIKLEAEIVTKGQGGDPIADIIKGFKKNERIDEQAANALSKYVTDLRAAKIEVEKYRKALEEARAAGDKPGALQAGKNLQAAAAQYATLRNEYSALATTIKKISEHADSAKFGEEKVRRLGEQAKSAFEALDSADKKIRKKIREFGKLRSTAQENAFLEQERKLLAGITAQITELGNEARIAGVKFKEKGPLDDLARELHLLNDITEAIRRLGDSATNAGKTFQALSNSDQTTLLNSLKAQEEATRKLSVLQETLNKRREEGKLPYPLELPSPKITTGTLAEVAGFTKEVAKAERGVETFFNTLKDPQAIAAFKKNLSESQPSKGFTEGLKPAEEIAKQKANAEAIARAEAVGREKQLQIDLQQNREALAAKRQAHREAAKARFDDDRALAERARASVLEDIKRIDGEERQQRRAAFEERQRLRNQELEDRRKAEAEAAARTKKLAEEREAEERRVAEVARKLVQDWAKTDALERGRALIAAKKAAEDRAIAEETAIKKTIRDWAEADGLARAREGRQAKEQRRLAAETAAEQKRLAAEEKRINAEVIADAKKLDAEKRKLAAEASANAKKLAAEESRARADAEGRARAQAGAATQGTTSAISEQIYGLKKAIAELKRAALDAEQATAKARATNPSSGPVGTGRVGGPTGEILDSLRRSSALVAEELRKTEDAATRVKNALLSGDAATAKKFFEDLGKGTKSANVGIDELQANVDRLKKILTSRANAPEEVKKALAGLITEFENGIKQLQTRAGQLGNPVQKAIETAQAEAAKKLNGIISGLNANQGTGFNATAIRKQVASIQQELTSVLSTATGAQIGQPVAEGFVKSFRDTIEARLQELISRITNTNRAGLATLAADLEAAEKRVANLESAKSRLSQGVGTPGTDTSKELAQTEARLAAARAYLQVLQQQAVIAAKLNDPTLTAEETKKLDLRLKALQAEQEYILVFNREKQAFTELAQAAARLKAIEEERAKEFERNTRLLGRQAQLQSQLANVKAADPTASTNSIEKELAKKAIKIAESNQRLIALAEETAKQELIINEAKGQKLISQEQRIAAARAEEYRKLVDKYGNATKEQVAQATLLLEEGAAKRRAIEQGITADMEVELKKRIEKAQEFKPTQTIGGQKFSTNELFKDTAPQTLKALQELTEKEKQLNAERQALLVRSTGERIKAYEVELQRVQDVINRQTEITKTAYAKENEEQLRRLSDAQKAYARLSGAQEAFLKRELAAATGGSDAEKQITAKLAALLDERAQVELQFGQKQVAAREAYAKKIEQVEADSLRANQQALANRNAATLKELAEYGKTIGGLIAKIEAEFVKLGGGTAGAGNASTQVQTLLKNFKELSAFVGNDLSKNISNYAKSLGNLFVDQERLTTQLGNIKRELKEFTEGRGSIVGLTGSFIGLFNALGPVNQGLVLLGASAKLAVSQMKELTDRVLLVSKEQTNLQRFTQVSVETLEALRLGIERAGGMAFFLESSLQSLGNAIQTTSLDATSKQAQAFEFFGVAATDAVGNARKMEEVILDLSVAFQDTGKRGNLKAIQDLFGFFGTKGVVSSLITLEQLQKQVKETGTAISLDAEGPLRDYQISIFEMDHAVKAFEVTMAKQFGPTLAVVNKSLTTLLETVTHFLSLDINRGIVNILLKGLEAVVGILTNVTALVITLGTTILAIGPTVFKFVQKTASGFVAMTGDIRAATKALIEMEAQAKKTALAAQGIKVPPVVAPSGGGAAPQQGKGIAAAFGTAGISIFAILGPILAELITGFYRDAAAAAEEEAIKQAAGANKLLLQMKKAFDEGALGKSTEQNLAKYQELQAELAKGNSGYVESALRVAAAENRVGLSYRESAAEVKRLESALKTLARERSAAIAQVDERGRQGEFGTGNDIEIRKLEERARINRQFDQQETENLRRQIALKEQFAAKEIQQNKDFQAILSQLRSTTDERQRRELLNRLQFEGKVGQEFVKLYEDLSAKEIEIAERKSKERIDIEKATQEAIRRERERTSRELQQSLEKESILLEEANQKNRGTPVERERRRADIDQSRIRERINTASGTIGGFEQAEEIKKQESYVNELREAFKKLDIERAQAIEDLSKGTVFGGKATVDALNKVIKTTSVMVNGQRVTREEFERLAKTAEEAYATISEKAEKAAETDREIAKGTIEGYNNVLDARIEQLEKERAAVNTTTQEGAARAKAIEEEITRIREAQSSQRIETIEREAREVAVRQRAEVEGTKASAEEIEQIRRDKAAAEKDLENQKLRDSIAIQRAQTETELLELRKRETGQENNFRQFLLNQEKRRASGASEVTLQSELLVAQDRRFAESISNLRQQLELEKQLNGENEQTIALEGQLADLEAQRIQARQSQAQNVINAYKGQADGYRAIAEQVAYLQLEEEGQFLSSQEYAQREIQIKKEVLQASIEALETEIAFRQANNLAIEETLRLQAELLGQVRELKGLERGGKPGAGAAGGGGRGAGTYGFGGQQIDESVAGLKKAIEQIRQIQEAVTMNVIMGFFDAFAAGIVNQNYERQVEDLYRRISDIQKQEAQKLKEEAIAQAKDRAKQIVEIAKQQAEAELAAAENLEQSLIDLGNRFDELAQDNLDRIADIDQRHIEDSKKYWADYQKYLTDKAFEEQQQRARDEAESLRSLAQAQSEAAKRRLDFAREQFRAERDLRKAQRDLAKDQGDAQKEYRDLISQLNEARAAGDSAKVEDLSQQLNDAEARLKELEEQAQALAAEAETNKKRRQLETERQKELAAAAQKAATGEITREEFDILKENINDKYDLEQDYLSDRLEAIKANEAETLVELDKAYNEQRMALEEAKNAELAYAKTIRELDKADRDKALNEERQGWIDRLNEINTNYQKELAAQQEAYKKEYDALVKQRRELLVEYQKSLLDIELSTKGQLEEIGASYDDFFKRVKDGFKGVEDKAKLTIQAIATVFKNLQNILTGKPIDEQVDDALNGGGSGGPTVSSGGGKPGGTGGGNRPRDTETGGGGGPTVSSGNTGNTGGGNQSGGGAGGDDEEEGNGGGGGGASTGPVRLPPTVWEYIRQWATGKITINELNAKLNSLRSKGTITKEQYDQAQKEIAKLKERFNDSNLPGLGSGSGTPPGGGTGTDTGGQPPGGGSGTPPGGQTPPKSESEDYLQGFAGEDWGSTVWSGQGKNAEWKRFAQQMTNVARLALAGKTDTALQIVDDWAKRVDEHEKNKFWNAATIKQARYVLENMRKNILTFSNQGTQPGGATPGGETPPDKEPGGGTPGGGTPPAEASEADIQKQFEADKANLIKYNEAAYQNTLKDKDLPDWAKELAEKVRKGDVPLDDALKILDRRKKDLTQKQQRAAFEAIDKAGIAFNTESGKLDSSIRDRAKERLGETGGKYVEVTKEELDTARAEKVSEYDTKLQGILSQGKDLPEWARKLLDAVRKGETSTENANDILRKKRNELSEQQYNLIAEGINAAGLAQQYESGHSDYFLTDKIREDKFKESGGAGPGAPGPSKPGRFGTTEGDGPKVGDLPKGTDIKASGEKLINAAFEKVRKGEWTTTFAASYLNAIGGIDITKEQYGKAMKMLEDYASGRESSLGTFTDPQEGVRPGGNTGATPGAPGSVGRQPDPIKGQTVGGLPGTTPVTAAPGAGNTGGLPAGGTETSPFTANIVGFPPDMAQRMAREFEAITKRYFDQFQKSFNRDLVTALTPEGGQL